MTAYVLELDAGQVDPADGDAPRPAGALLVAAGLLLAGAGAGGPLASRGPALEVLGDLVADERPLLAGQVAAETVGEGGRVVGHRRDDHRQDARSDGRPGLGVDDLGVRGRAWPARRGGPTAGLREDGDRLARRDDRAGPLLGELDEGAHRLDEEEAVAEEADELPDGEPALGDLARAEPHQGDDETAREQHADGLDGGEPAARPRRPTGARAGTASA